MTDVGCRMTGQLNKLLLCEISMFLCPSSVVRPPASDMQNHNPEEIADERLVWAEPDFQVLHEIVAKARQNLNQNDWDYIVGATETETTLRRNRFALDSLGLRPRVLCDVSHVDATVTALGRRLRLPIVLAPVGSLESFYDGAANSRPRLIGAPASGSKASSTSRSPSRASPPSRTPASHSITASTGSTSPITAAGSSTTAAAPWKCCPKSSRLWPGAPGSWWTGVLPAAPTWSRPSPRGPIWWDSAVCNATRGRPAARRRPCACSKFSKTKCSAASGSSA